MRGVDALASVQIGNGPGDLENAVVGPSGQIQPFKGHLQNPVCRRCERTDLPQRPGGNAGIAALAIGGQPGLLVKILCYCSLRSQ